jgi:ABC-type phosphate transport system substrate-binding protein
MYACPGRSTSRLLGATSVGIGARAMLGLVTVCVAVLALVAPASADTTGTTSTTGTAPAVTGTPATGTAPAATGAPTTTSPSGSPSGTAPAVPGASTTTTSTTFPPVGKYVTPRGAIAHAGAGLNGAGSSFAAPAIETFQKQVQPSPYSLNINYTSTSSGDGRYEFTNGTTDFAVSDIAYGLGNVDTTPPNFKFIYVPVTAGGIAFMYNIPGLSKTLQLDSYTTCAILTGGITNWNDSHIAALNPGVPVPNLAIKPVTESDPAGTNYVLQEWCIAEQPALWAAFANYINGLASNQTPISATAPNSQWPPLSNGLDADNTTTVANDVTTNAGAIGGVQLQYATDQGFGLSDTSKGVVSEKNASGSFAQPTPVDVASALAYATQLPNGTHQLNFGGVGVHVYNPSTYSYLLSPAQGWQASKGATMSSFVNYALTVGQQKSPSIGYASLGLSLERWGVDEVLANVPGAIQPTSTEQQAYACGDLTPAEVAAGQTTPTCGVTNATAAIPGSSTTLGGHTAGAGGVGGSGAGGANGTGGSGGANGAGGNGAGGVDPGVSLGGSSPLAFTGGDPGPLVLTGMFLLVTGWLARRRLLRLRRVREQQ